MRINIVLPFFPILPTGGIKIMYQIANLLARKGMEIRIYHSVNTRWHEYHRIPPLLKYPLLKTLYRNGKPKWYVLEKTIKSKIIPRTNDKYISDADILISTNWAMAYETQCLSSSKGNKINFIQGYEIWEGQTDLIHQSYRIPMKHIVISRFLEELFFKISGAKAVYTPIAIDFDEFHIDRPIPLRNNKCIIMMYSGLKIKGSQYGIRAIFKMKRFHPDLSAILFGVGRRPDDLPQWIRYYRNPSNLPSLYNEASIFISPSLTEGWALPPAEAMGCGCAVICTDIGGHHDYAIDNETALLVRTENVEDICEKLDFLLNNNERRIQIAINGNSCIQKFNWPDSLKVFEQIIHG